LHRSACTLQLGRWVRVANPDAVGNTVDGKKKPNAALAFGFFGSQPRYFNFFRGNYWPR